VLKLATSHCRENCFAGPKNSDIHVRDAVR
jgi:hypothetical protein